MRALCEQAGRDRDPGGRDDAAERAAIWTGRKSAFAAVGRISPAYIVQDGVVPRTALPAVLDRIAELSAESGIRVANVFHAGDGNLHPLVLFDDAAPRGRARRPRWCPARSWTCASSTAGRSPASTASAWTSPGTCRRCSAPTTWTPCSCCAARSTRPACATPGKIFPTPRLCGEVPGVRRGPHPLVASGEIEQFLMT